jgi:hypothetical protein
MQAAIYAHDARQAKFRKHSLEKESVKEAAGDTSDTYSSLTLNCSPLKFYFKSSKIKLSSIAW